MKFLIYTVFLIIFSYAVNAQKMSGHYLNDLSTKFKTPHLDWATKLSGGKLKVLFVLSLSNARHAIEAAQRMDLTLDAVTTALRNHHRILGITKDNDGYYGMLFNGSSESAKKAELLKKLDQAYEVIVINKLDFKKLSDELKLKLFLKIKNGCGLMLLDCLNQPKGLFRHPVAGAAQQITALSDSILPSNLQTYKFGKGRIILSYAINTVDIGNKNVAVSGNMIPVPFHYTSPRWWAYYENAQAYFMRAMLWAANRKPGVKISSPILQAKPVLKQAEQTIPIKIQAVTPGSLKLRLRNEFNRVISEENKAYGKLSKIMFKLPFLPAGVYYLDLIANSKAGTENLGFYAFSVKSPISAKLSTKSDAIKEFSPIHATLKLNRAVKNGTALISLVDSPYGRIWYRKEIDISGKTEIQLEIKSYYMPNLAAFLNVEIKSDGNVLCVSDKAFFFPIYQTKLPMYLDTQWEYNPGGIDILRSLAEDSAMGNSGIWVRIDGRRPEVQLYMLLNQRLMAHCYNPWISNKKQKNKSLFFNLSWVKKYFKKGELNAKDIKALDNAFTLGDRVTEQRNRLAVEAVFRNKKLRTYPLATHGMGNEVSCSYDNGFTKVDDKAFRQMLKREYGSIVKLNNEWGRNYTSFAKVPHLDLTQARKKKLYPEYLAHMRYINNSVKRSLTIIAEEIKKRAPHAIIGSDGIWSTNNAGFNMEDILADKNINTWGPYTRLPQLEILRSIRPDLHHLTVWGWVTSPKAYPEAPWFNLIIGTCNEISWFISGANTGGIKLSADYTPFHDHMQDDLHKLRTGTAQVLISNPLKFDGIAIWENYNSTMANRLGDSRFIQSTESSMSLINFCYQYGLNFDYIVKNTLDKLKKYKVLFLCGASSMSEFEEKAILEYVKSGGTVIADLYPGLINDSYRILHKNRLAKLFGECNPEKLALPSTQAYQVNDKINGKQVNFKASSVRMFPGAPTFRVQKYGKGRAILLNGTLGTMKISAKGRDFDKFMLDILNAINIKPELKINGLPAQSVVRLRSGRGFELIGLTNRRLAKAGSDGDEISITLPKRSYVYEVGSGFVCNSNTIKFKFAPPFKVFSVFKDQQSAPKIKLSSNTVTAGTPLILDLSVLPVGRIMRLQLRDKIGKIKVYRNEAVTHEVFETGKISSKKIHFAYNYPKGEYIITLSDVTTGLNSNKTIILK